MKKRILIVFICLIILIGILSAQTIKINEVMSMNGNSILDDEEEPEDWIELYNFGNEAVNLHNFGLSDNNEPYKWIFPDVVIELEEFLTVFASGKDKRINAYWETVINWGDEWNYFLGNSEPPVNWNEIGFDASSWLSGPSGFGDGDDDDATIIEESDEHSLYIRKEFSIANIDGILTALLHIDFDDAFVAFINGEEIAREQVGFEGNFQSFDNFSNVYYHEAELYRGYRPSYFILENIQSLLQDGINVLAIHTLSLDSDMSMIPFLTLGFANEPVNSQGVHPVVEPNLLKLHTNFKISDNESISLYNADDEEIDRVDIGTLQTDVSFGRKPDATSNFYYFFQPTPDSSNTTETSLGFTEEPMFDIEGGFYHNSISVTLSATSPTDTIYYALDGSKPSREHYIYSSPIVIDTTTVIRARVYRQGSIPSKIVTHSYIMDSQSILPVVSLSTTPANLWDYETGIYALGPNAGSAFPFAGANFWQDWERPVHVEIFEPDGSLGLSMDGGIKIFGFASRGHAQKSLAIFARSQYGYNQVEYKLFEEKPIDEFESFVLRNSGGDWNNSMFRDGMMVDMLQDTNLGYQAYRPVILYINGVYWGIQNIREKLNEHFYAANYGIDPDNLDYLENNRQVIHGDINSYNHLMQFVANNDLSNPQNYYYVTTLMDIENFISYQAAQIFYANTDWPGANIKYFSEKQSGAKWRWQIFDLDLGLGLWEDASHNTLAYTLSEEGGGYANPLWATLLFRKLVENQEFTNTLVNRFADFMNTIFTSENLINTINETSSKLEQEMPKHLERWDGNMYNWENELLVMTYFSLDRPENVNNHIMEEFGIPGSANVQLNVRPGNTGKIQINSLKIDEFPWNGTYFLDFPINVKAIPNAGYKFVRWEESSESENDQISLNLSEDINLIAFFAPSTENNGIVINEINYNSSDEFDTRDWLEIYNSYSTQVDLSNWSFKDSDDSHIFSFPQSTILNSKNYLVLCRDTTAFTSLFPDVDNFVGELGFGLSGAGELLRLFDETGTLVDSVLYMDTFPWPIEPDGFGATLSLKNPIMDNSIAESWAASEVNGTPGEINDVYEDFFDIPDDFVLFNNYPNPFKERTGIEFSIPQDSHVIISIYNIRGQFVKNIIDDYKLRGIHYAEWDGKNSDGKSVATAVYIYTMKVKGKPIVKKMLLLK